MCVCVITIELAVVCLDSWAKSGTIEVNILVIPTLDCHGKYNRHYTMCRN